MAKLLSERTRRFLSEEAGQDLVEYTLLLAFVALVGAAIYIGVSPMTSALWTVANSRLTSASN